MKSKSQVFEKFVEWKALVETSSGQKPKTLRSDNGGEYTSAEFTVYLKKEGVRHELTVSKTPQQNGVAERMNRTLVESVRSMCQMPNCPRSSGLKHFPQLCIFVIVVLQQQSRERHHLRLGPKRSLMLVTLKSLAACVMHTYLKMNDRSLMERQNTVSCWDMVLRPRHIDCMILNVREFSSAVTWSSMNLK